MDLGSEPASRPDLVILSHQRSGTHLLATALASHPCIRTRGEFLLPLARALRSGAPRPADPGLRVAAAQPGFLDASIVMYNQLDLFQRLFGPLRAGKVVHLVRDPLMVARSALQNRADRALYGEGARAHYRKAETPPRPAPLPAGQLGPVRTRVAAEQARHREELRGHPGLLEVSYEELTDGREVGELPPAVAARLLAFAGVETAVLYTSLRKTGVNSP